MTPSRARVMLAVAVLAIVGCGEDDDVPGHREAGMEADLLVE